MRREGRGGRGKEGGRREGRERSGEEGGVRRKEGGE